VKKGHDEHTKRKNMVRWPRITRSSSDAKVTYPWSKELDKHSLSISQFFVIVWGQARDVEGTGRAKGSKESNGGEFHCEGKWISILGLCDGRFGLECTYNNQSLFFSRRRSLSREGGEHDVCINRQFANTMCAFSWSRLPHTTRDH